MPNPLERTTSSRFTSTFASLLLLFILPLFFIGVYQTVTILQATGKKANIVVNAQKILEPVNLSFIRNFAQGGEEATDMLAPVIADVAELRPEYIRLDHLYDYYEIVSRDDSGQLVFTWDKFDQALNSILATGAKPLLALSYMPPAIAKEGVVINPPNDWNEWALVVQRTIEHVSGKDSRAIEGVYYEVWNEPDLAQFGSWKPYGDKNYLTLYEYAAKGAANAQNVSLFYFGGPSTTGLYKNWIMALVNSGLRVDFFSWHSYLANPTQYATDQKNISTWLADTPRYALLPKLITEFGFTGAKDERYATDYATAHAAAAIRQVISQGVSHLFTFELKSGPSEEVGWGLVSHETQGKQRTPRYFLYNFLAPMDGTRLELTGEGTWVTGFSTLRDGTIRIMLVNFHPDRPRAEQPPVAITNLENGQYVLRTSILGKEPKQETKEVTNGSLVTNPLLQSNAVVILEITKQP